jgi:hypothetical protein
MIFFPNWALNQLYLTERDDAEIDVKLHVVTYLVLNNWAQNSSFCLLAVFTIFHCTVKLDGQSHISDRLQKSHLFVVPMKFIIVYIFELHVLKCIYRLKVN